MATLQTNDMDSSATLIDHGEPQIATMKQDLEEEMMSKLLSKAKNESMYELRRLQHQQCPVTKFCSKQQLEEFFCKRIPPPQLDSNPADHDSNGASLVTDRAKQLVSVASTSQDFMPEGVRLEVRGLFEQRRVTETLEGPLRQEMDRVLQDGLERRRRRGQGHRIRSGQRYRGEAAAHHRQSTRHGSRHVRFNPPENGQYPLPRRNQSQIVDSLLQSPALNSLTPGAREEIVSEVRGLVQQQLVTSALSGEFRGVLELNIQQRLNHSQQGLSGEDFVRSLQQGATRPSSEAGSSTYSHSGGGDFHHEMRAMKSQLDELKQMVKTSFELQLDIQRSIRQEVAAALSALLAPQQSGASLQQPCPLPTLTVPSGHASIVQTTSPTMSVVESGNCVICSDNPIDSVVYRCGHMCTCILCGMDLKSKGMKCPVCRAPITDIIRAYSSML